jgi:hypothetical protein
VRTRVQRHVRRSAGRLDRLGGGERVWDVLCECGDAGCEQWVALTADEYETLRARGGAILAPGHRPMPRARVRGAAREALEGAVSLWARTERRLRRAGRRLGGVRRR